MDVTAEEARRRVNCQVVTELGTGLAARDPELVIAGELIVWRVPIVLSFRVNREPVCQPVARMVLAAMGDERTEAHWVA